MADASAAAPAGAVPKLDELMLAMDVVDTLRHQQGLVDKVMAEDQNDATLKARLRKLYEGQGLAVSDRILDEGIRALKESRFVYDPAPPGMGRTLALMWVRRGTVARIAGVVLLSVALLAGVQYWRSASAERAIETARIELGQTLPAALAASAKAARASALSDDAKAAVEAAVSRAQDALAAGKADETRTAIAAIDAVKAAIERTYELRLVSRPGERSGVFRIPDANSRARNYYLIVEAVAPDGSLLRLPVTSEEDGKTVEVSKWGQRVPRATYDKVAADKQDDGIIEDNVLGEKPRGALVPVYEMKVEKGAITAW